MYSTLWTGGLVVNSIILSNDIDLFFIPDEWQESFKDCVIETYISITETQIEYKYPSLSELPCVLDFIEEEEVKELCDLISCSEEYGMNIDELELTNEEDYADFAELCHDNLIQMTYDIDRVLNCYKMPYTVGTQYRNMPFKEVW
jgi:hypothetical protein